ncbi:helix-turn-helix domain-containing protein, partial [Rhodococcus sp. A14]|uniref:helix-turn-helix domain-containing protein n=1 Tax=Rhodococcus sp. A14 TaxID=1194106 RepID=UPI001ED52EE1|nr:hypothetical protein [Rhodococcus sp. A14]
EKLRRHRWDQDELQLELPTLGTEAMVRRLGRAGQDAIFALEFIEPVAPGQVSVGHNPKTVAATAGAGVLDGVASHLTRPTPYGDVQRQLTASADVDGLIRVVGDPGSGKRHQASRWLRRHTSQEPEVVAARDLAADDAVRARGEAALRDGRGIVVVGGDDLTGDLRARLGDFAMIPRPGVPAGARVILTERTGDADNGGADAGPAAVRVPSLTELRDELPAVVREVAAELFPGAPALRFSPAALQCLLAWHWPGNVAELARLLTALPQPVRSGLIQTKDLPADMHQTSWSSLSRYEQAERETIKGALREADGNKARAAKILGIGRTTLYRKMRALKIDAEERMIAPGR